MAKVDIKNDNIRHCRCPVCPVQANSSCVKERLERVNNETDASEFKQENSVMLYCAIGKSGCSDLDGNQSCLCPTCLVWNENDLESMHYCLRGNADEIG